MIDKTHLNLEGAKLYVFSLLLLGTCIGNNVFWVCVCAVVCLRAFFWELTVTGNLCWVFLCSN